jgi:UPF0271 protein
VKAEGGKLQHVKPHGALYNMAAKDAALAEAMLALSINLILRLCSLDWPAANR